MGRIRIIAGKWRGRNLTVLPNPTLRPTPNRIRETLFNWLSPFIVDAKCLDLFCGTGALGVEALSRGAKSLIALDNQLANIKLIKQTLISWQADNIELRHIDAISWLEQTTTLKELDIIFLDPPFHSDLLINCLTLLSKALLKKGALIYFETNQLINPNLFPQHWKLLKQKTAGDVVFGLIEVLN